MNFEEIKKMPTNQFKEIIRKKCKEIAFEYLMSKIKFKGSEIKYNEIETAEYLMPNNQLNNEEKLRIFSIRNRMVNIPANFISRDKNENKCICKQREEMKHIYECLILNEQTPEVKFEEIFGKNIEKMKKVLKRLDYNMKQREKIKESNHVIPYGDPPYSVTIVYGNG